MSDDILKSTINSQEKERNWIGTELHSVGAVLSGVKISLQVAKQKNCLHELDPIISQMDDTIRQVREISSRMIPFILNKYGLKRAIEELITQTSYSCDVNIHFHAGEYPRLLPENELLFYRILQELLNNAIRHSQANQILIELKQVSTTNYQLRIEDNGVGFTSDILNDTGGDQLMGIKSRALILNGQLLFSNTKTGGAEIILEIPQSIH